jgi:rhamnopyranosyl-N-acetylglucosaminyl-diphospho-decaprenol beta-1,3/1,4-galactofuranosyltransferase
VATRRRALDDLVIPSRAVIRLPVTTCARFGPTVADRMSVREATRRVFGVMCTFRRRDHVGATLAAIGRQSLQLDLLVVVDNDDDPAIRAVVEGQGSVECCYLGVRPNSGPAGAFNFGLVALPPPESGDLVVFFDDDDPPVAEDSLDRLVARLDELTERDPAVGGLGLHGGLLDIRRGRVNPPEETAGVATVDHLHGGYLPVYRRSSLQSVGGFDAGLFWGFEELDLGRRLVSSGSRLCVDMDHWRDVVALYPKARARRGVSMSVETPTASRYYSLRNLLRVLGRERCWRAILAVVIVRAIGKPLAGMAVRPRFAWANLAMNLVAVADSARGRMGPRDRFPSVCRLSISDTVPGRTGAGPAEEHSPAADRAADPTGTVEGGVSTVWARLAGTGGQSP